MTQQLKARIKRTRRHAWVKRQKAKAKVTKTGAKKPAAAPKA